MFRLIIIFALFSSNAFALTKSLEDVLGNDKIEISPVTYQGKRVVADATTICALAGFLVAIPTL